MLIYVFSGFMIVSHLLIYTLVVEDAYAIHTSAKFREEIVFVSGVLNSVCVSLRVFGTND